jgi:hypothetical protein
MQLSGGLTPPAQECVALCHKLGKKLFPNNLHQHSLRPPSVEFAVEDLLPRAEIELTARNGDYHFAAHDLPFQMRIGVVFARAVVMIARR